MPPDAGPDVEVIEQIVLRAFCLPHPTLRAPSRGRAEVAFARQVAIYMVHVHLGLSLTRSAQAFCRDRTTAAHACRTVEDRRDSRRLDRIVGRIDAAVAQWLVLRRASSGSSGKGLLQ